MINPAELAQDVDALLAEYPELTIAQHIAELRRSVASYDGTAEEVEAIIGELERRAD